MPVPASALRTGGESGRMPDVVRAVDRCVYRARHYGLSAWLAGAGRLWGLLIAPDQEAIEPAVRARLRQRFADLLEQDLANVDGGYYPRRLLHQLPAVSYLRAVPEALADLPRVLWRRYNARYGDLPAGIDRTRYPRYYLRTFHWQTDGWLSERSARLYDLGVEFLFGGTADIMRRMAIPPLVDALRDRARPRILDVGCGTGRFLWQLQQTLPAAKLFGLDLSAPYLRRAAELLGGNDVSLVNDNAEAMPWAADHFDAVTSVFLFHELPSDARRRVMREVWRVLKPGGRFVVSDSAQLSDSRDIEPVLHRFPASYHEPYYAGYLRDDLGEVMRECGFALEASTPHLVSKVVVGRKPERPPERRRRRQQPDENRKRSERS
ncbi:MAG: class I SAM-dependent methyltransferase [Candidatus Binatia bacterium]